MIKYTDTQVTFREVPDEITLCINLSLCPYKCKGCHSPELRNDIGEELTEEKLDELIRANNGITCVCFMGGDNDPKRRVELVKWIREHYPNLKTACYSGNDWYVDSWGLCFDYFKVGSYKEDLGPLDNPNTNQIMYENVREEDGSIFFKVITNKFWNGKNIS